MAFSYLVGTRDSGLGTQAKLLEPQLTCESQTVVVDAKHMTNFDSCASRPPSAGHRFRRVPSPESRVPLLHRGFTLLEMLAVIVLLGIVAVIVARSVSGSVDKGKWGAGKIGVTKLDQDVQAYALDNGSPPPTLQDLLTKPNDAPAWNGPYAKPNDLKDPFGHPYGYADPGKHGRYDIIFYGADGKPGGDGIDRDYGNWQ